MKTARIVLALILALAAAPLAAQVVTMQAGARGAGPGQQRPPLPPSEQPRGAIVGTVVSASSGQPIDRVRLQLRGDALRGTRTIYSDDDGRFAFLDLPAGSFTLAGSKTGYVGVSFGQTSPRAGRPGTPIDLQPGQQIKDLVFQLPPGGVITGVVFDEKSRPSVATPVRVMRWTMSNGERRLTSAGTSTTDDRGIYRVYGLAPGDYLVSAMPRNTGVEQSAEMAVVLEERLAEAQAQGLAVSGTFAVNTATPAMAGDTEDEPAIGYAPVFYPGTMDVGNATAVTLGVSQELTNVDIALQQVPLSRVEGVVIVPPDLNVRTIQVRLYNTAVDVPGVGNRSTRVRDGEFSFSGVPPGQYRVVATADVRAQPTRQTEATPEGRIVLAVSSSSGAERLWGMSDISVAGQNASNVTLVLQPGLVASGSVAFEGATPPPSGRIRVTLAPFGGQASAAGASSRNANVDELGRFEVGGLVPAHYRVRVSGAGAWTPKSAVYGGLDTLDYSLDLTGGQDVEGLYVAMTDQRTEVTGAIQDQFGTPTSGMTVIIFPTDERYWLPQARRIQSAQPSTAGAFSFLNLPPGNYRLAAVSDVEPGIWFDPQFLKQLATVGSVPFSLSPGQTVTQNIQIGR